MIYLINISFSSRDVLALIWKQYGSRQPSDMIKRERERAGVGSINSAYCFRSSHAELSLLFHGDLLPYFFSIYPGLIVSEAMLICDIQRLY